MSTTDAPAAKKGTQFWMIFLALTISVFLAAMELSAVSTALPVIVAELQGEMFVWAGTAYALASCAFLPITGGLAEIFGRRLSFLSALLIFSLGCALCGSARSMAWLIGARVVQGLGGAGILSLSSIIVSDLVSLQERGAYNGLIGLAWATSTAIGPLIGGALANAGQWRWIFYMNIPICVVAMLLVIYCLRLPTPPGSLRDKISRMDWIGTFLVVSSTISVVIALTWGGVQYSWSSARVLVPLVVGCVGLMAFLVYEARSAKHPIVPFTLLSNRSSLSGYIQTFINSIIVLAVAYYLPVYYQACKDNSVLRSGVNILGMCVTMAPIIILGGLSVTISKRYRPQIWFAWIVYVVGMGVFSTIRADTPLSMGIGLPILLGAGAGILASTTYFPVLAPLPVTSNAHALAFFAYCRAFAGVWGVSIGATILDNELVKRLPASFLEQLPGDASFVYAAIPQVRFLPQPVKDQVRNAFADSLAVIWQVMIGVLGIGLLASLFMKDIPLQNLMDEKWGIQNNNNRVLSLPLTEADMRSEEK